MKYLKPLPIVFLLMLLVIFILPFYSAEGYSIIENTTSQLGAQLTPNAWIMNLIFIALATASILDVSPVVKKYPLQTGLLATFGIALIFTAIFSHAPINENLNYNVRDDAIHSILATITGFAFSFFAISIAFIDKPKNEKIIAFSAGIISTLFSILFFVAPDLAGLWQRIIFISSFAWLVYFSRNKY